MSWQVVAQKDLRDSIRSRWLWVLSALFVSLIAGTAALVFASFLTQRPASAGDLFGLFASLGFLSLSFPGMLGFVLAFIALITSYGSVIEEQTSGSLKLLLSLPHSRRDVVAGKLAGRSAVVVLPVLAGFLLAIVALLATGVSIDFSKLLPHVALTALLGIAFVAVGVGVSAASETNRQATVGTLGLYMLFAVFWPMVAQGLPALVTRAAKSVPGVDQPQATSIVFARLFVKYANPLRAYETLVAHVYFGDAAAARLVKAGLAEKMVAQPALADSVPFYLTSWFIFAELLLWIVVPPLLGYWLFEARDL
ncbi:MAG: ABC transporter permease [Haloferacaceae archaeon]